MINLKLSEEILLFFENIDKYFTIKTEITEGLTFEINTNLPENTTWNLSEFNLQKSGYRKNGDKFMFEGAGMYYEIAANLIIDFKEIGRNKFEFTEQYAENVFRITKIRFHYKY